jgi:hypothetical protein
MWCIAHFVSQFDRYVGETTQTYVGETTQTYVGETTQTLMVGFMVLTPLVAICQLYRGDLFYCRRKPEDLEKTTDLSQVTDKLYHIMLYTSP